MGCTYCFAKARGGFRGDQRVQFASSQALKKRLKRASQGGARGAFEEFLQRRVPLQLGGMTDPFSTSSVTNRTIFEILETLNEFDYPTIISTKGRLSDIRAAMPLLSAGNYYVRLSIAASCFEKRLVEPGTPSQTEIFDTISMLEESDVATCLRIQPIFPDADDEAIALGLDARNAGARAVSLEYLKVPQDRKSLQFRALNDLYGGDIRAIFEKQGISTDGREFSLSLASRINGMKRIKGELNISGIRVGIAENELLHYGDLPGCCNGGSEYLRNSEDFDYNMTGILKNNTSGLITYSLLENLWRPSSPVGRHFNSHSRFGLRGEAATWENFFKLRWNDARSRFNPTYFHGVSFTQETDNQGNAIYFFQPDNDWA
jgi:DNA repair photolyase